MPLKGVDLAHDGLLVGTDGAQQAPLTSVATGSRYYVFNLLAELDSEGEWFLSRHGETTGDQAISLFEHKCQVGCGVALALMSVIAVGCRHALLSTTCRRLATEPSSFRRLCLFG